MLIKIGQRPDHGFDEPLGLLSDCHRRIEHFLWVLVEIARQEGGGPLSPARRTDLQASLAYFANAAPKHTADEEESLFPRLRSSSDPDAARALDTVAQLEREHDEAERHHADVETLVRRWLAHDRLEPADTGALRAHLAALQAIYTRHIGIEDRDLFPAAGRVLSPDQIREIGREMAARRS